MIQLHALGTLVLKDPAGEHLHAVLAQPKRVALLAYLAIARPRGFHRRDTLLALLWPEQDEQHARWALNQALRHLRAALGRDALPSRGDGEVGVDPQLLTCDVVEFEAAIDAGDHERALALYRGDLLEGFHLSGAGEFERWMDGERERLRGRAAHAAAALAQLEESRANATAARQWARRALALAPYDEGQVREIIALLGRLGDRAGAMQAYEEFARRLRDEFEVDPAPETIAVIDAVRARQRAAPSPAPPAADDPAPPESPPPPPEPQAPRRRRLVAGVVAVVMLVALALAGAIIGPSGAPAAPGPAAQRTAIAVLPFANLSPDGADEYVSDGMAEEIMTALSRIEGLRVTARTSAFAFKGKGESVREIGRQLGVGTVVEGSVRREGNRLRVAVQLVDVADGYHLWAETYDRDRSDVFAVQEEIAQAIVAALELELRPGAGTIVTQPTADLVAYDRYLEGRHALNQRSGPALAQAVAHFEGAIARDSAFAEAYAGLADAYLLFPGYTMSPSSDAWPRSRAAAERALALDSTLAEAHTTLAYGAFLFEGDWRAAERGFRRAIALNPAYAAAHHWYSDFLGGRGDLEGFLREIRRAHALDPLSRQIGTEVGRALWALQRNDEAIAQLQHVLRADSAFAEAHVTLGRVYLQQGRLPEAIAAFEKGVELRKRDALDLAELAYAYAVAGRSRDARQLLAELEARAEREYVSPTAFGIVHMGLGDAGRAFDWLERAAAKRDGWLAESIFYPIYNPLRSHPRYAGLLEALHLR